MAVSQRDVRNRIASVKNIQKITRAMEMVAAARLRRAEQRIEALRPYAGAIRRMTRQAAEAAGNVPRLPILAEHESVNKVGLLRGRRGPRPGRRVQLQHRPGRRRAPAASTPARAARRSSSPPGAAPASSLTFRGLEPAESFIGFTDRPAYADARRIAERLMAAYIDGEVDQVEIFYNGYVSPLTQVMRRETLLPLQQATLLEDDEAEDDER